MCEVKRTIFQKHNYTEEQSQSYQEPSTSDGADKETNLDLKITNEDT